MSKGENSLLNDRWVPDNLTLTLGGSWGEKICVNRGDIPTCLYSADQRMGGEKQFEQLYTQTGGGLN